MRDIGFSVFSLVKANTLVFNTDFQNGKLFGELEKLIHWK